MDKKLPSEIWIKIFMFIPVDNMQAVCNTCVHWKNIVENYNLWTANWLQLLCTASKTNLKNNLYSSLKQINGCDLNLKHSCVSLKNVLYDKNNKIYQCLLDYKQKTYEFAVLKTHYSKVSLTLFKNNTFIESTRKNNDCDPTNNDSYLLFRKPPKLLDTICSVFKRLNSHRHIHQLLYIYPLGMSSDLNKITSLLFECCHVHEVILIPRVLALCENLDILDGLVVLSGSRSTEVALVVDGRVEGGRWTERLVGGWKVAQSLHVAFQWHNPNADQNPKRFEAPAVKKLCWLPAAKNYNRNRCKEYVDADIQHTEQFMFKDELHISAELMYSELGLVQVVEQLSAGLTDEQLSRCLSHVLLAGGNCKLQHLHVRVRLDLMARWPQHAQVISTSVCAAPAFIYTPPRQLVDPPPPPAACITAEKACRITRHQHIVSLI